MSHTYLLDLYKVIEQRLNEYAAQLAATDDKEKQAELQGRMDTLVECGAFLGTRYHHKLPRRLRQQYSPPQRPGGS